MGTMKLSAGAGWADSARSVVADRPAVSADRSARAKRADRAEAAAEARAALQRKAEASAAAEKALRQKPDALLRAVARGARADAEAVLASAQGRLSRAETAAASAVEATEIASTEVDVITRAVEARLAAMARQAMAGDARHLEVPLGPTRAERRALAQARARLTESEITAAKAMITLEAASRAAREAAEQATTQADRATRHLGEIARRVDVRRRGVATGRIRTDVEEISASFGRDLLAVFRGCR